MRYLFLLFFVLPVTWGEWVDPHSMDSNRKSKLKNRSEYTRSDTEPQMEAPECSSNIHMKRIVRLILNNAHLDDEVDYQSGYLHMRLTAKDHTVLKKFSQSPTTDEHSFFEISSIFENAFQKTQKYDELVLSLQERIYNAVFNPASVALFGSSLALILTYKLLKAQFTWKSIAIFFMVVSYLIDFIVTYIHIIQEEEVESMVKIKQLGSVPPECDPQKMSWIDFIKTQFKANFFEDPCLAYYHAISPKMTNLIAPSKIFNRQFKNFVTEPFAQLGDAFGKFGRGMFTSLPWGLNFILWPFMLVTVFGTFFLVYLFLTRPNFKINFLHFFTIEIKQPQTENQGANVTDTERRFITHSKSHRNEKRRKSNNVKFLYWPKNKGIKSVEYKANKGINKQLKSE